MREFSVSGAPHMVSSNTVGSMMRWVLVCLVPGILAHWYFFGWGILFQLAIATAAALLFEWLSLRLRRKPVRLFLLDGSAIVTAWLFALCIPPLAPWWIAATGMLFAIVVAKHLYGGLGHNVFNPALVGYVVVLIAFPLLMTQWLPPRGLETYSPGFMDTARLVLLGTLPTGMSWDSLSGPTPLDTLKTGIDQMRMVSEIRVSPIFGDFGGRGWEWIANFFALGGIVLLIKRVISWHIPLAVLGGVIALSLPAWVADPGGSPIPLQHIFSGGLVLAAFFIATDPVTGCASVKGKLIFGFGVAVLTLVIRRWGGYPDGVAFAVLLMNMAVPLIDRYTRPRTYGHRGSHD